LFVCLFVCFALHLFCCSPFCVLMSLIIAISFFFLWFSHSFCILSSTFAHIYLYLFSFCLYIFWF
jgi:hypothetical protein